MPPEVISRRMNGVNEMVTVRWKGEWTKAITNLSRARKNSTLEEEEYKRAVAYWARYPEEEWWRIASIRVANVGVELLELEIAFLNPGKAYEFWLTRPYDPNAKSLGDFARDFLNEEIIAQLGRQLNSRVNSELREVRQEHKSPQPTPQGT